MSNEVANGLFCVVDTRGGKVQGRVGDGVRAFHGIPYGAPTGGPGRFRAPRPAPPWTGTRECLGHAPVSPQVATPIANRYGRLIQFDLNTAFGGMGEDCLHLNLWAPPPDGAKRPVLFCIHGGGFAIGSGNSPMYDGAQLARSENVVVVSVTHRLAAFGYLNLADLDAGTEDFSAAGVAGILDLILALEWVRDNIEAFGGDPGRVTIFGQSGGGWKTSVLLAAPAARGLFHRAMVQSGSLLRAQTREQSAAVAAALVAELGLTQKTLGRIRELPWQTLLAAQAKIGEHAFAPVLDGHHLAQHPCDPQAPQESRGVPLIVSTTLDDASLFFDNFDLDENGLAQWLAARHGDSAPELLRLYRRRWPHKAPFLLQAQIVTDSGFRRFAQAQAERKAAQGAAPVYCYRWDWVSPALDGLYGAVHASDVCASLGNERDALLGAGVRGARELCRVLAQSLAAFAATGDPNHSGLPAWPAYTLPARSTLIFDTPIRVDDDPHAELREFWDAQPPAESVFG